LIQDTRLAPALPSWLSVLPAIVNTKQKTAWRGQSCLKKILTIELPTEHLKRLGKKKIELFSD
jgi:hypothetical protein